MRLRLCLTEDPWRGRRPVITQGGCPPPNFGGGGKRAQTLSCPQLSPLGPPR